MLDDNNSESGLADWDVREGPQSDRAAAAPAKARPADRQEKPAKEAPAPQKPQQKPDNKPEQPDKPEPKEDTRAFWRRRPLLIAGIALLGAAAVTGAYVWYDNSSHFEETDDAFIAARQTTIAPKVTGYVIAVPVTDNQHVKAGDVIARIDPRDYQTALDQANAQVEVAKANIANVEAQRDVQTAQIAAAKAQVDQARAALDFAKQQAQRYQTLAQRGSGSVQNAEQYTSQLGQQDAAVKSAEANEKVAERQLEALKAQLLSAQANLISAQAQRDQAQLNLGYTTVRATEPGRIVQLSAEPGELAQPGANLAMFVPDETWITANFKETQLARMRPGQPVEFTVDAYPGRTWKGHVDSVQPGSGTAFSLLPAQNATGNYVKIVQRVPVKLTLDSAPKDVALGPGMSVVPDVRVDPTPSLWERLTRWWAAQ